MLSTSIDSVVDNFSASDLNQSLLEFTDISKQHPINSLLHNTGNIVERTVSKAVRSYMSGKIKFNIFFLYFNSLHLDIFLR